MKKLDKRAIIAIVVVAILITAVLMIYHSPAVIDIRPEKVSRIVLQDHVTGSREILRTDGTKPDIDKMIESLDGTYKRTGRSWEISWGFSSDELDALHFYDANDKLIDSAVFCDGHLCKQMLLGRIHYQKDGQDVDMSLIDKCFAD